MDKKTVPELRKLAKSKGYSGYSKLKKDDLLKMLSEKPVSKRKRSTRRSSRRKSTSSRKRSSPKRSSSPRQPKMTETRKKMIHRAHIITGIHKADLQDLPMDELRHYASNFPKQIKLTENRKSLIDKVAKITGVHKADLQNYPTDELKRYLGQGRKKKSTLGKEWTGKRKNLRDIENTHKKFSSDSSSENDSETNDSETNDSSSE